MSDHQKPLPPNPQDSDADRAADLTAFALGETGAVGANSIAARMKGDEATNALVTDISRLGDRIRKVLGAESLPERSPEMRERLIERCQTAEAASRALGQLRPEQRQVLEMSLLQGLSQAEIATALNLPLGTVKTFMRRGLIKVREALNLGDVALSQGASA